MRRPRFAAMPALRALTALQLFAPALRTGSATTPAPAPAAAAPHVVFVVADDLGWNEVQFNSVNNSNKQLTPVRNALVAEGVVLADFLAGDGVHPRPAPQIRTRSRKSTQTRCARWSCSHHVWPHKAKEILAQTPLLFKASPKNPIAFAANFLPKIAQVWNCLPIQNGSRAYRKARGFGQENYPYC